MIRDILAALLGVAGVAFGAAALWLSLTTGEASQLVIMGLVCAVGSVTCVRWDET